MARILVSYWRSDEISANATLNFWDGFFKELCDAGNDVLAINNSFYNIWTSNKTDDPAIEAFIHDQVDSFRPELIITFNNRILQSVVDKYKDIPVVIYDGDELRFFSDLDTIRRDIKKYKIFSIVKSWRQNYLNFGFKDDQIYYMPSGTALKFDQNVKQYMNISFLGQRRWYLSSAVQQAIKDGRDLHAFYKSYLEYLKTGSFDYESLFLKNGGLQSETHYSDSDLWPLFDDAYLVLAHLLDLGLHIGGHEGKWRDIVEFIPQLATTHSQARIFTLEENQLFYNSSILSLSPMHPQAHGTGFSWRCFDVMASNACLISSYSSELKDSTSSTVNLPMYKSPAEAREICIDLLNNEEKRKEIVVASHEYVEKNCRWYNRFVEMEQILGLNLVNKGIKGKFIKLPATIPEGYTRRTNKTTTEFTIVDVEQEAKKNFFYKGVIYCCKKFFKLYEKISCKIRSKKFSEFMFFSFISLGIFYLFNSYLFDEKFVEDNLIIQPAFYLFIFWFVCLFISFMYYPLRIILRFFVRLLKKVVRKNL